MPMPSLGNAAQFYLDLADAFPKLGIGIYHNPPIHRVTIPVDAFKKLVTRPNIVFMKDSHRTPLDFYKIMNIVKDKIAVFVMQLQLYPYFTFGPRSCCARQSPAARGGTAEIIEH